MDKKNCFLFVGIPGTGKSAIINGYVGKPVFKSGISRTGFETTYKFDQHEEIGMGVFMDTPGLADDELKQKAAEAITEALRQDGFYRIFFVVTLEAGRIHVADKTTMKLILEAAPTVTDYSIIVNKVEKRWLEQMHETLDAGQTTYMAQWLTVLSSGLPKITSSIHFNLRDEKLADFDNVKYKAPLDVINFIRQAPGMLVAPKDVKDVKADEMERMKKEYALLEKKLTDDHAAMQAEMEKQTKSLTESLKRAEEAAEEAKKEAKKHRKDTAKREAQLKKQYDETVEEQSALIQQIRDAAAQQNEDLKKQAKEEAASQMAALEHAKKLADEQISGLQTKIEQVTADATAARIVDEEQTVVASDSGGYGWVGKALMGIGAVVAVANPLIGGVAAAAGAAITAAAAEEK